MGEKILIVEDHHATCKNVSRFLHRAIQSSKLVQARSLEAAE